MLIEWYHTTDMWKQIIVMATAGISLNLVKTGSAQSIIIKRMWHLPGFDFCLGHNNRGRI